MIVRTKYNLITHKKYYDARYKLNRYFSPMEQHTPKSIEELFANNDIELFDVKNDPNEMNNLAMNRCANSELLVAMNDKLNVLIESEVGDDDGQMLPAGKDINWKLDPGISKLRM